MRKLIIVAPMLPSRSGHFLNELLGHRLAAQALDLPLTILLPRDTPPDLVDMVGGKPVLEPLAASPLFHPDIIVAQLIAFASAARPTAQVWTALEGEHPTSSDLILFVQARAQLTGAVGRWLAARPPAERPAVFFRFLGWELADPRERKFGKTAIFHRLAAAQLRGCPGEERVFFLTEGRALARAINRICERRAFIMPMPELLEGFPGGLDGRVREERTVFANFTGGAPEMLSVFIEVVRRVRTFHPRLRYLVKCTGFTPEGLPADVSPVVEMLPNEQEPAEYLDNFRRASLVLLGYGGEGYRLATSGVFIEAASFGRPVVVPAGTTMADNLRRGIGVGTLFGEPTANSLAAALLRALSDFDTLLSAALAGAPAVRAENTCRRYLQVMDDLARTSAEMAPVYDPGDEIEFGDPVGSRQFLGDGWSDTEAWGVWTSAAEAKLCFRLDPTSSGPLTLRVLAHALLHSTHRRLHVAVRLGERRLAEWVFDRDDPKTSSACWCEALIPAGHGLDLAHCTGYRQAGLAGRPWIIGRSETA